MTHKSTVNKTVCISCFVLSILLYSCAAESEQISITNAQQVRAEDTAAKESPIVQLSPIDSIWNKFKGRTGESTAHGTVGNGWLENGYIFPYKGNNWFYFDSLSYVKGRAFAHNRVVASTLDAYSFLDSTNKVHRLYGLMECSFKKGGMLWPHRTHQNGLSIDFMTPMLAKGEFYHGQYKEHKGASHYLMDFDDDGVLKGSPHIEIDFNTLALHLLALDDACKENGLRIKKVLFKIELKDELFATEAGRTLKNRGIYFAKGLKPVINALHDDHYHVDFELID